MLTVCEATSQGERFFIAVLLIQVGINKVRRFYLRDTVNSGCATRRVAQHSATPVNTPLASAAKPSFTSSCILPLQPRKGGKVTLPGGRCDM